MTREWIIEMPDVAGVLQSSQTVFFFSGQPPLIMKTFHAETEYKGWSDQTYDTNASPEKRRGTSLV